jgi:Hypothetical protein (DUF2513)
MKRNMDLVRQILLATEKMPHGELLRQLPDVKQEDFVMHAVWLKEAGLIEASAMMGSGSFAQFAAISRLTWAGTEFTDAMRDESLWLKAKEKVMKPGMSFTLDIVKDWLKAEITHGLPTLRRLTE